MKRWIDVAWLFLWVGLSSLWIVTAARELSATFDEPFYLKSSMQSWRSGSNKELMRAGTMPLPIDLQYLPVYLWEQSRGEPFDLDNAEVFHRIFPVARSMNLVFWWLMLGYGLLLGRFFGGDWGGRFAVGFLACEPSLLGHACLATTDIAIVAMMFVFTYHYALGRQRNRWARWILPGILYGLAMCAKASALMFVPIVMGALEIPVWWRNGAFYPKAGTNRIRHLWQQTVGLRSDFVKILAIGTIVLWFYCGTDWKPQASFVTWAASQEGKPWHESMDWLANHATLFPNAGEGLMYQIKHNIRGHGVYFYGDWYKRALWYYFPVAMTIKLTIIVLLTLVFCLTKPRSYLTPLNLISLLLLIFSLNCRVQIGIRIVFPLLAFVLLTASVTLSRRIDLWSLGYKWLALAILGTSNIYPAWTTWPDGLRYANELWGGPENIHRILSDSNSDWGQGLIDLDRTAQQMGLPLPRVWYFGTDPNVNNTSRSLPLHSIELAAQTPEDVEKSIKGQVVAVSLTVLFGNNTFTPQMKVAVDYLKGMQPIGRSRSFLIYDFR